jgi:glycosyltransferase involved in cell wall biosynthesis
MQPAAMTSTELSIVIPVLNEREALPELFDEVQAACSSVGRSWEAIIVDDGSTDGSWELLRILAEAHPEVIAVKLRRNFGKSAALAVGFAHAHGQVIVTLDGDGQDDPAEIEALLDELGSGYDLVSGWKRERHDAVIRRWASRLFNAVASRLSGVRMHDMNCGLKAYNGDCARALELYGELHRFTPILAAQQGWRVREIPVRHRSRLHGRSRFGPERYSRGFLDLITVLFIGRYQHRPLHLFGGLGLVLTLIGAGICVYLTIVKIGGASIGERPLLFLGVLLIVVGVQVGTLGLLGQMLTLTRRELRGHAADAPLVERVVDNGIRPGPAQVGSGRSATETPLSG